MQMRSSSDVMSKSESKKRRMLQVSEVVVHDEEEVEVLHGHEEHIDNEVPNKVDDQLCAKVECNLNVEVECDLEVEHEAEVVKVQEEARVNDDVEAEVII